ncbi:MAG: glycosyltransferase family 1 protein [Candidatus Magasanikbacteria bacterium]|nr:glycosyltransferase family 1 protein [Candidatus Magasanikbacteria bacterium]
MKIGIDISQVIYEGTGVGRFTTGLVEAIIKYAKHEDEWVFFLSSFRRNISTDLMKLIESSSHKFIKWPVPPRLLSVFFNEYRDASKSLLPLKSLNELDWFISSDWTEPPLKTKKATIVHDLVFKRYPETVEKNILKTQELRLKWVKKESRLIFCDSKVTACDLQKYYSIPETKLIVNYPGVEILKIPEGENVIEKYNITAPFILTVGKREPRKNLDRLIKAYQKIESDKPTLVIVGEKGWGTTNTEEKNIIYLGFVPDNDLVELYRSCLFLIMPSLYEGFGYPVIEAMLAGCPVATSDTSSLSEITKGAAHLFDPNNTDSINMALLRMSRDKALRSSLIDKGRVVGATYSWARYYNTLISSLKHRL